MSRRIAPLEELRNKLRYLEYQYRAYAQIEGRLTKDERAEKVSLATKIRELERRIARRADTVVVPPTRST